VGVGAALREQGDADLGGDTEYRVIESKGVLYECSRHLVQDSRQAVPILQLREHHGEMMGADARCQAGVPQVAGQPLRHLPQQLVTGRLPEAVVDVLESLEVD